MKTDIIPYFSMRIAHAIELISRKTIFLFPLYLTILFVIYYKAEGIVLTDDAFQFFAEYEKMGWDGFYQNYGFTSLYYVTHFVNIILYHLFGTNTLYWSLFFITLHAGLAVLLFRFLFEWIKSHHIHQSSLIALISSLWFLLSPNQTENICWVATLHYNLSLLLFLLVGTFLIKQQDEGIKQHYIILSFAYIIALLTMEVPLVFPFCWYLLREGFHLNPFTAKHKKLWLSFAVLIVLYFIATKLIKGHFIPHYADVHLSNHNLYQYALNYARYCWKYICLGHFIPHRERYYMWFEKGWMLVLIYSLLAAVLIAFRKRIQIRFVFKNLLLSFVLLLPMINMYFMVERLNENSRLGYFFSIFIFPLVIYGIFLLPRLLRFPLVVVLLGINIFCSCKQAKDAAIAGHIYQHCLKTFPKLDGDQHFLLNLPNNYKGYYLFRAVWRLESALQFFNHTRNHFIEVNSINLLALDQKIRVSFDQDSLIRLSHEGNGVYFMQSNYGATSRTNEHFSLTVDEWSMNETIAIKHFHEASTRFLIFEKDSFRLVHR